MDWQFSDRIDAPRQRVLSRRIPFSALARRLADTARPLCLHHDAADEGPPGYARAVACLTCDPDALDVWFNGAVGLRGQYFDNPVHGTTATMTTLLALMPVLAAVSVSGPDLGVNPIRSLTAAHAKVWVAEIGKGFCDACAGEVSAPRDDAPDILNGRWDRVDHPQARWGRKAPRPTQLRGLGGFVSADGAEWVAPNKVDRAMQIHEWGWT